MPPSDESTQAWFLTAPDRGNEATGIDRHHEAGRASTPG